MEILKVSEVGADAAARRAAVYLSRGGLIIYPTDTLYGIGVNALDPAAVGRLKELKARDKKKPISILVSSVSAMHAHGVLNQDAQDFAYRFLPGALTLVVPAKPHLPSDVTHNGAIGIRVPDDPFAKALSAAFSDPVTATSANMSGTETPATVADIIRHFGPRIAHIDLLIDDGPRAGGIPSTVVLLTGETPRVLREGAISKAELGI